MAGIGYPQADALNNLSIVLEYSINVSWEETMSVFQFNESLKSSSITSLEHDYLMFYDMDRSDLLAPSCQEL